MAVNHAALDVVPVLEVFTMPDPVRLEPKAVAEHDGDYYCMSKI